jgi:GT2 family glycosyltransferase
VNSNWLEPLISALENYPDAGVAGSRILNPDGGLQEAGAFIDELGHPYQVGTIKPYHPNEELETRVVDYCSGACLAVPKRIFSELGGFDPIFIPGYYEDVDLCLKIASTGRFVYYCADSTVIHVNNATSNAVWSKGELSQLIERNRQKLLSRWGNWLRARAENRDVPFPTFERSLGLVEAESISPLLSK